MKLSIRSVLFSLLDFLGSMSFAITLLISVSIVALIGTLISQGQSADFYLQQFGSFWAEMFAVLSVNDIFNSAGFFILVGLLFISITVCIWRRAPAILQEFSTASHLEPDSKAEYVQHLEWQSNASTAQTISTIEQHLQDNHYKYQHYKNGDKAIIVAHKGMLQRLGYIFIHFGVLVIILGALLDANIPLRVKMSGDDIHVVSDRSSIEDAEILTADSGAFRGNMQLGIGHEQNYVILHTDEGYVRRQLPFSIKLQKFDIEYYADGKPKTFSSTLEIQRPSETGIQTYSVEVANSIEIDGYRIYQKSYQDAGSKLILSLWNLDSATADSSSYDFHMPMVLDAEQSKMPVNIRFVDFVKDSSNPLENHTLQQDFHSIGPALYIETTSAQGFRNNIVYYLKPHIQEKKAYYLLGVKGELDKEYRYGFIPAGKNGELEQFIKLNSLLNDSARVRQIIRATAKSILKDLEIDSRVIQNDWIADMENMLKHFLEGGSRAVLLAYQPDKPTNRLDEINADTMERLQTLIEIFYTYVLDEEKDVSKGKEKYNPRLLKGYPDMFAALDWVKTNNVKTLFQVNKYQHQQGSVLEVNYYPGYYPVIIGMMMLLAGIMLMFYIHQRRLEIQLLAQGGGCQVSFTGSSRKSPVTLKNEFDRLLKLLRQ